MVQAKVGQNGSWSEVTEHTKTDSNGNATSQMSAAEQKKQIQEVFAK